LASHHHHNGESLQAVWPRAPGKYPARDLLFELLQGLADERPISALFTAGACVELGFVDGMDVPARLRGREAIRAAWDGFCSKHPPIHFGRRADILLEEDHHVIAELLIRSAEKSNRHESFFVRLCESGGRVSFLRIVKKSRRYGVRKQPGRLPTSG